MRWVATAGDRSRNWDGDAGGEVGIRAGAWVGGIAAPRNTGSDGALSILAVKCQSREAAMDWEYYAETDATKRAAAATVYFMMRKLVVL